MRLLAKVAVCFLICGASAFSVAAQTLCDFTLSNDDDLVVVTATGTFDARQVFFRSTAGGRWSWETTLPSMSGQVSNAEIAGNTVYIGISPPFTSTVQKIGGVGIVLCRRTGASIERLFARGGISVRLTPQGAEAVNFGSVFYEVPLSLGTVEVRMQQASQIIANLVEIDVPDSLFSSSFENGDLDGWSASVP